MFYFDLVHKNKSDLQRELQVRLSTKGSQARHLLFMDNTEELTSRERSASIGAQRRRAVSRDGKGESIK